MEKISINNLEHINGGSFVAGFCGGVAAVRLGAAAGLFALNPVVGGAMLAVTGGCLAYGIYNALS